MKPFFGTVYRIVRQIPRGKVATYGQIARLAGKPHAARMVGWAMSSSSPGDHVPWHRVVGAGGRLVITKAVEYFHFQKRLLQQEGVEFLGDRIVMASSQWEQGLTKKLKKPSRMRP
jgi:methylated-DNA-protein-cysteine methyltransferase-like protein